MAAQTTNVSGVASIRIILSTATTQLFLTNAVDGQILVLILQQDATGGRLVTSGNIPAIGDSLDLTAAADTVYILVYDASTNTWTVQSVTSANASLGSPEVVAAVNLTGQGFAVFNSATPVTLVPIGAPAGTYRVGVYLVATTTFVTNTEEVITIGWTDDDKAQTVAFTTTALAAGSFIQGTEVIRSTGTAAITYTPSVTGTAATAGVAAFSVVVERIE